MTDRTPSDAELDALLDAALPPLPEDPGAIDRLLARLGDGPELGAMLPSENDSARLREVVEDELLSPSEAVALEEVWLQLGEGLPGLPADPAAIERCLAAVRAESGAPQGSAAPQALGAPRGGLGLKLGLAVIAVLALGLAFALQPWAEDPAPPKPPVNERGEEQPKAPVVVELPEAPKVEEPEAPKAPAKPREDQEAETLPKAPSAPISPEGPIVAERPKEAPPIEIPAPPSRKLSRRERLLAMAKAEGFGEEDLDLILNLELLESLDKTRDDVLFSLSVDYETLEDLTEEDLDELTRGR